MLSEKYSISVNVDPLHSNITNKVSNSIIDAPSKSELINKMSEFYMTYKRDYKISFYQYVYTITKSTSSKMDLLIEGLVYREDDQLIPRRAM